jgi:hypothetical protein
MRPSPEQTFFDDPAIDRAVGMIMALAAELYLVRDRLRALERTLEAAGTLTPGALDAYKPDAEEAAALAADRDAFVAGLLEHVVAAQKSRELGDAG